MTHDFNKTALAVALLSLGFSAGALAQPMPGKSAKPATSASTSQQITIVAAGDRKFIEDAAADGVAEVEMGKLAVSRATDDGVKKFAQRMVTDHSKANEELRTVASNKNIQVLGSIDKRHQKGMEEMQKKDVKKFDHEYMEMMVKEHKKDVSEFEKQSKSAKDPDIKAFATKTLPTLKEHLALAQSTQAALKGGGGASK